MNETPRANRIHIAFFGLRNAGKSTLVNAFTGQRLAIVSATPGTTTDPVSKAMEILPLGPCLVTDTAGLDDVGDLGAQRVAKSLAVLATTDVAVWVWGGEEKVGGESRWTADDCLSAFREECRARHVTVLEYRRGDSVAALKEKIASLKLVDDTPGLLNGLVGPGDRVVCVCPIDEAAPKGRLILPQVQVIRAALDLHATCEVCQVEELSALLETLGLKSGISNFGSQIANGRTLIVTDSQAFGSVKEIFARSIGDAVSPPRQNGRILSLTDAERLRVSGCGLTSFSILFARQKGDLDEYVKGLAALKRLRDGDTVLVAEGCTHHRQCNDIGTVKIPKAVEKLSGRKLNFTFASGADFVDAVAHRVQNETECPLNDAESLRVCETNVPALIVQCGGCMLTRREVLRRIGVARDAGIPIVNYGMVLAAASGIEVLPGTCCVAIQTSGLPPRVSCPGENPRSETRGASERRETRDMT